MVRINFFIIKFFHDVLFNKTFSIKIAFKKLKMFYNNKFNKKF